MNSRVAGSTSAGPLRARIWFNEELESTVSIVPGLVAVVMMIVAALLTSLTIAREWERGTMEQLVSTPVTRGEVIVGKLIPYVVIGAIDVAVVTLLGVTVFDVPFRGSVLLFAILTSLFLFGALGLGVFISAAAKSQLLSTQLAMITTFLPAFLLSGFMFAIEVMPLPLQAITHLVPARYFVSATRGIFLKSSGVQLLAGDALLMLAFAVLGVGAAVLIFRKRIA